MANDKLNGSAQRFTEAPVDLVTETNKMVADREPHRVAEKVIKRKQQFTALNDYCAKQCMVTFR